MYIYFFLFFLIIIFGILLKNNKQTNKKIYCIVVFLLLFFIVALRNPNLGILDTSHVYVPNFLKCKYLSFEDIMTEFKDPVFFIFAKIFMIFSSNSQLWLAFIGIPLLAFVSYMIYKESRNPILSFIMFISLGYFGLCSFTILRHAVALAFIVLSYFQLKNNKNLKFIALVLIASLFHQSALVFLPTVFLKKDTYNSKITKKYIIILICYFITILFKQNARNVIMEYLATGRYLSYVDRNVILSYTPFYINLLILLACDIIIYNNKQKNYLLVKLMTIGTCISCFSVIVGEFYRLSMFYTIFSIILLPNVINENKSSKEIISLAFSLIFILYFLLFNASDNKILPYMFFWE